MEPHRHLKPSTLHKRKPARLFRHITYSSGRLGNKNAKRKLIIPAHECCGNWGPLRHPPNIVRLNVGTTQKRTLRRLLLLSVAVLAVVKEIVVAAVAIAVALEVAIDM